MFRKLVFGSLLATVMAPPVIAQTAGGPPIAYSKLEGGGSNLYLTNPNGNGTVKLYSTPAKRTINSIDLKPGGNEVAIIEVGDKNNSRPLKIITYNDGGGLVGTVRTLVGPCAPLTVDYHPTQPLLIISDMCNGLMRIATIGTDGSGYNVLHQGTSSLWFGTPRWLADGISYVYARAVEGLSGQQLCRDNCATPLWSGAGVGSMDVARNSNLILFDRHTSFISKVDGDTGTLDSNFISGTDGHYSDGDSQVLFETPHAARGDYLDIWNSNGSITRLTGKGDYFAKDWRK